MHIDRTKPEQMKCLVAIYIYTCLSGRQQNKRIAYRPGILYT